MIDPGYNVFIIIETMESTIDENGDVIDDDPNINNDDTTSI